MGVKMKIKLDRDLVKSFISLASVIEARDPYTGGHTWRVSQYGGKLAQAAGLSSDEVFVVKLGGLVHDLGKIGISDAILLKPDKLTDEEYATMQEHPRIGMELLSNHPLYPVVMPSVIEHHVRADGKGYPQQMEGKPLTKIGKITAIADAFDAMTSTRPYRKGMPVEKAIAILESEKDKQFDGELVSQFVALAKNGELDHILGHCGDERLMMTCHGCGPIVAPPKGANQGDHVACPNCHGDFIINRLDDNPELEWTGKMLSVYVPNVDQDAIEEFMVGVPDEIELAG